MSQALAPYLLGSTLHQWLELCALCQSAGEFATASKAAAAGLREHGDAWELEVARSRALTGTNEPAEALRAAERAVRLAGDAHDAWCALAAARGAKDDVAGGLEAARRALESLPDCASAQATLGTLLLRSGEPAQAAEVLRPLSRRDALRAQVSTPYLQALLYSGRYDEVVREADRLLVDRPDDAYPYFAKGTALIGLGRWEQALDPLRRATAGHLGRAAPVHANLAHAYEKLGRRSEAIDAARESVLEDDGNAASHLGLARLLLQAERSAEALPSASRAADLAPSLDTFEVLLMALVGAGRPAQEIVSVCDRALALAERDARWRLNRAVALNMAQRYAEAERQCVALLADLADDAGVHAEHAKALAAQGRADEARAAVEKAERLAPGDAAVAALREEVRRTLAQGAGGPSAGAGSPQAAAEGDATMLSRLAAIQDARDDLGDPQAAARAYEEAFQAYGIDLHHASAQEIAAGIRVRAIADSLVTALDAWRHAVGPSGSLRPRLDAAVRAVDTDPWRARLRDAGDLAAIRGVAADADCANMRIGSLLEVADRLTRLGAGSEARDFLTRLAVARPADFRARLAAGFGHARATPPHVEEATRCYAAAGTLRPSSATPSFLLGELRRSVGDLPGAAEAYVAAIRLQPGHTRARTALATVLQARGDLAGAERAVREAILQQPSEAAHRGQLADLLSAGNRSAEALQALRAAVALEPDEPRWHAKLGRRLREANLGEEAVRQLSLAVKLAPQDPAARLELGLAEQQRGNLEPALEAFRAGVRLDERSWEAHRRLAWLLTLRGEVDAAIEEYEKVKNLRPDDDSAWNDLAGALYVSGEMEAARALWEAANARFPESIVLLGSLGRQRQWDGKLEESFALRRRAHELAQQRGDHVHPTAAWLAEAEQALRLQRRLDDVLRGQGPAPTPTEAEDLAAVAQAKGMMLPAARLHLAAFEGDPELAARDLNRWTAARAAVAVGLAGEADPSMAPTAERGRWLERARGWIDAELALLARRAVTEPEAVRAVLPRLARDRAFAGVRGGSLEALPASERADWARLWNSLEALRTRLSSPVGREAPAAAPR